MHGDEGGEEEEEAVKRAAERAERREAEREVREAERERLREEKETARALGRDARGEGAGLGRRDKGGLGLKLGAKRRTPSVELEEGIGGGWGAHAAQIAAGDRVEVAMKEEGLASVAYLATLVEPPGADGDSDAGRQHRKLRGKGKGKAAAAAADAAAQVHVRYDELLPDGAEDDSAERLCEPVPAGDVRPQPPPTPCGFHALVAAGDIVELYYDDGWWEVKVEAVVPVPKAAPAEGAAPDGGRRVAPLPRRVDDVRQVAHRPRRHAPPAVAVGAGGTRVAVRARRRPRLRRHGPGRGRHLPVRARHLPPAQQVGVLGGVSQ